MWEEFYEINFIAKAIDILYLLFTFLQFFEPTREYKNYNLFLFLFLRRFSFFRISALMWITVGYHTTNTWRKKERSIEKHFLDDEEIISIPAGANAHVSGKLVMIPLCWALRTTDSSFWVLINKSGLEVRFEKILRTKFCGFHKILGLIKFAHISSYKLLKLLKRHFRKILFAIPFRTMPKIRWKFSHFPFSRLIIFPIFQLWWLKWLPVSDFKNIFFLPSVLFIQRLWNGKWRCRKIKSKVWKLSRVDYS